MNSTIDIVPAQIAGETVQTVSARDLHASLEVGKDFTNWIKNRIRQYGFAQGEDFEVVVQETPRSGELEGVFAQMGENPPAGHRAGGRPATEYFITLDMAKELAMVERNERGRQIRRYFIEVEKRWRANAELPNDGLAPEPGGQRLPPGQRFAEERRRLGYATKREFAEATGLRLNIITSFEDLNGQTNKLWVVYRLMDAGFDLRYWQTGFRTPYRPVGPEESALLQAWRRAGVDGVQRHLAHVLAVLKRE